jgi:hypothetical protein
MLFKVVHARVVNSVAYRHFRALLAIKYSSQNSQYLAGSMDKYCEKIEIWRIYRSRIHQ